MYNWLIEPSWSWWYCSQIYDYLCNQCLSQLMLWVRIPLRRGVLDTTLCDKCLSAGRWFSPSTPVSSTNKTDRQNITEILLKVALNTITLALNMMTMKIIYPAIQVLFLTDSILMHRTMEKLGHIFMYWLKRNEEIFYNIIRSIEIISSSRIPFPLFYPKCFEFGWIFPRLNFLSHFLILLW